MKTFNIAIAGLGNIGLEVYKNLTKNKKNILEKTGFKINISNISVRNPRKKRGISLPKNYLSQALWISLNWIMLISL